MKPAPAVVGATQVLWWTTIDGRHVPAGTTRHVVDGKVEASPAGLAICGCDSGQAVYLFGCDEDWNPITDTWHPTLQDALAQAETEYAGVSETWACGSRGGEVPLDRSRLATASSQFAARLFAAVPEAEVCSSVKEAAPADLEVEIPSPTGDPDRAVVIWMEDGVEPSVGFGEWHTHAGTWQGDIVGLVRAILDDQFVLTQDMGGEYPGAWGVVDLRVEDALAEELTSEHSPGRVTVRSWSGRGDLEVSLEDL